MTSINALISGFLFFKKLLNILSFFLDIDIYPWYIIDMRNTKRKGLNKMIKVVNVTEMDEEMDVLFNNGQSAILTIGRDNLPEKGQCFPSMEDFLSWTQE